jgi:hypothetical protein
MDEQAFNRSDLPDQRGAKGQLPPIVQEVGQDVGVPGAGDAALHRPLARAEGHAQGELRSGRRSKWGIANLRMVSPGSSAFVQGRRFRERLDAVKLNPVQLRLGQGPVETVRLGGFYAASRPESRDPADARPSSLHLTEGKTLAVA